MRPSLHVLASLFLLLPLVSGCADSALTAKGMHDTGGLADTNDWDGGEDTAGDSGFDTIPASYTIEATLVVSGGAAVTKGAALSALVVGDDGVTILCRVPLDTAGLEVDETPDPDIGAWWAVDVDPTDTPCAPLPTTLNLGIGVMAPDVLAQLGAVSLDTVAASLFGAYIAGEDGTVYAFGWAGTESDVTGDDEAAMPLPDGVYGLHPLYLLPLP